MGMMIESRNLLNLRKQPIVNLRHIRGRQGTSLRVCDPGEPKSKQSICTYSSCNFVSFVVTTKTTKGTKVRVDVQRTQFHEVCCLQLSKMFTDDCAGAAGAPCKAVEIF